MESDSKRAGRRRAPCRILSIPILCLAATAWIGGCGIEDYPYLYPASGVSDTISHIVNFTHNTENDEANFFGYEVYYRIYENESAAATDGAVIETNWTEVSPDTIFERLKRLGYERVVNELVASEVPLVRIDPLDTANDIFATLTFDEEGDGIINNEGVETTMEIRRSETDENNINRTFGDLQKGTDCEYAEATTEPSTAYIRAYVFAYGLSASFGTIISRPSLLTSKGTLSNQ